MEALRHLGATVAWLALWQLVLAAALVVLWRVFHKSFT
jgi:hypothetical protein